MNTADAQVSAEASSWWRKARTAYYDDDLAQALVCIEQCCAVHRDLPHRLSIKSTSLLYGSVLRELRRFSEAHSALSKALPPAAGLERGTFFEWGHFYVHQEQYAEAEKWHRKLIDANPQDTGGYIFLGISLVHQGKFEEAQQAYWHATELTGNPDEAFVNLGLSLRAQGRFGEAAKAFESALKLCPDYPEATYALEDVQTAIELQKQANYERLSDTVHIKTARDEISGMYLDNYAARSRVLTAHPSRVRQAINAREEKKVKQGDLNSGLWWEEAVASSNRNDMAQALVAIERLQAIQPDYFTLVLHGMILTDLCRYEEARATLKQASGLSKTVPKRMRGTVCMAWARFHKSQGRFTVEEEWCRKRIEFEPERAGSYMDLGSCLSRQSRLGEAEEAFQWATTLKAGAPAFLRLGYVRRSQGHFAAAHEALQSAVEVAPDCLPAKKALDDVRAAMELQRTLNSQI